MIAMVPVIAVYRRGVKLFFFKLEVAHEYTVHLMVNGHWRLCIFTTNSIQNRGFVDNKMGSSFMITRNSPPPTESEELFHVGNKRICILIFKNLSVF